MSEMGKMLNAMKVALVAASIAAAMAEAATAKSAIDRTEAYENSPAAYSLPDDVPPAMRTLLEPEPISGTLRTSFVISAGGSGLQIRLSNEEGNKPLVIGSVSVSLAKAGTNDIAQRPVRVTFSDHPGFVIPVGAPLLSDLVPLATKPGDRLVVSVFTPAGASAVALGGAGLTLAPGEQTQNAVLSDARTIMGRSLVTGIVVDGRHPLPVIVTLGDSITDGARAKPDIPAGYPETLMRRLAALPDGKRRAVVNAGIAGNRLLSSGWGKSALARLDRDVIRIPNVSHLIVLEGINDIGLGGLPLTRLEASASKDELIAGYRQVIERAHAHGIKVIGGTLMPFKGAFYYSPAKEEVRLAVNSWIRDSGAFDAVIDFEAIVRDPADPMRINPVFDSGDHLHPNDAGYRAMGEAIDLNWFR